jgi:hypothetical protein
MAGTVPTHDKVFCDILARVTGKSSGPCEETLRATGDKTALGRGYGMDNVLVAHKIAALAESTEPGRVWVIQSAQGGIPEKPSVFVTARAAQAVLESIATSLGAEVHNNVDEGKIVTGTEFGAEVEYRLWPVKLSGPSA